MEKITKTIRLPEVIVIAAEQRAIAEGISFTAFVHDALAKELGLPRDAATALIREVGNFVVSTFDRARFPADVTKRVIHQVRDDAVLRGLYDEAVADPSASVVRMRRATIHRRIGRIVRTLLGAKVTGRSPMLDPKVELIESHALLSPA